MNALEVKKARDAIDAVVYEYGLAFVLDQLASYAFDKAADSDAIFWNARGNIIAEARETLDSYDGNYDPTNGASA